MFIVKTKSLRIMFLVFTLSLSLTRLVCAIEKDSFWPQFHGPNRDNISTEKGLLKKWPKNGPALLWTAGGLGHGYSSISIADRMIYTAGNIANKTVVIALNLGGKILWKVNNGKAGPWPVLGRPAVHLNHRV